MKLIPPSKCHVIYIVVCDQAYLFGFLYASESGDIKNANENDINFNMPQGVQWWRC